MNNNLEALKNRADLMGIAYKANIGEAALQRKINDALARKEEEEPLELESKYETEQMLRDRLQKEGLALVRCRIANMNPQKSDITGEFFAVANRYIGTVRKFVPFSGPASESYHLPRVLFDNLKARKFQHIITKKVNGQIMHKVRQMPEFSIEELPPLTKEELKDLEIKQSANHSFQEDEF